MKGKEESIKLVAYVLAKNEERNIVHCLQALKNCGLRAVVLDSGSTDHTREIALQLGADVENYTYQNHLEAFRYVCEERTPPDEVAVLIDADMLVSPELLSEAKTLLIEKLADVAIAPVVMYWNGQKLNYGSLCPGKPFMFRGGAHYFEAVGHSEALVDGHRTVNTKLSLIHNDRKPFESYLASQLRYSDSLARRRSASKLSWRDYLRTTPLMMFAAPIASYLFRAGVFSGKIGLGYAVDRFIAEAIMYRQHIAFTQKSGCDRKLALANTFKSRPD